MPSFFYAWSDQKLAASMGLWFAFAALALAGCSRQAVSTPGSSGPVQLIDPNTVGEIKGRVILQGTPPEPRKILLNGEPECAEINHGTLLSPEVTTGPDGSLADVAVYVKSGLANYHFDTPTAPVELDQKNCMYQPRVLALMTNQKLDVQNQDPIQHNVHPTPSANPAFNQTQAIGGPPIEKTFAHPELAIRFMCNLHPWMRAYVFVFSHPYFQVTGSSGEFDLKNVPPGTYTLEAWQEKYGTQDATVTVNPKETKTVTFTFKG